MTDKTSAVRPISEPEAAALSKDIQFLLLDTKALEDWACPPLAPDDSEFSHAPSVTELVLAVDGLALRRWIWEDSASHDYRERGPLLVQVHERFSLPAHFLADWAPVNGGIAIRSDASLEAIHQHFMRLAFITLPDGSLARFSFDARKLSGWLRALDENRLSQWLGPIDGLLWRENAGPAHQWYQVDNASHARASAAERAFQLQSHELAALNAHDLDHFLKSLAHEALALPANEGQSFEWARENAEKARNYAIRVNIKGEAEIRRFFMLTQRHGAQLSVPQALEIINDTTRSPQDRLFALAALVNDKEEQ